MLSEPGESGSGPKPFEKCMRNLSVSGKMLSEFEKLKTGEERIEFANRVVPFTRLPKIEKRTESEKYEAEAKEFKELGNEAFGKSDYFKSVNYYTKAIVMIPQEKSTETLAIAVANRSAAFYHLQQYQPAIDDIEFVLQLDYPKNLRYKVLERKAKCLLALNRNGEAVAEFKKTILALDESKLSADKKLKMQKDIQIMLKMMEKIPRESKTHEKSPKTDENSKPRLCSPRNKIYVAACDRVKINEDPTAGRYAVAAEDIALGDTILIENAYSAVLRPEFADTNCQNCFKRSMTLYPCKNCSSVVFCSLKCRELAKYHIFECSIMEGLYSMGISNSVFMALRMITQNDLNFFKSLKSELGVPKKDIDRYEGTDYIRIYNLVHHEDKRSVEDLFERTVLALHLLRYLKEVDYFESDEMEEKCDESGQLSADEKFIGALILRHLQILQFNAHEISELKLNDRNLKYSESVFIGSGLYPTLALFNHSCDPGILRYQDGTKVVVRTLKPIKSGEIIAENYGPLYHRMKKDERKKYLKAHYLFDCTCQPCQENWITLEESEKLGQVMRFKCRAWKNKNSSKRQKSCKNVFLVSLTNTEFNLKCGECGGFTALLPCLKAVKDQNDLAKKAVKHLEDGNHEEALKIFLNTLNVLHEYLSPPFLDFLLTLNFIKITAMMNGNKYFQKAK